MTIIQAKIVADSISPFGVRITTWSLRYPRWFHAELLTHRTFSRNASSNRAIPPLTVIQAIKDEMAIPIHWGLNEPGMQANNRLHDLGEIKASEALWKEVGRFSIKNALELFNTFKLHKQLVNRLTESFSHINVVLTSTDFENFFALRCHPDTEPHLRILAWRMADAYYAAVPTPVAMAEWHLPYITAEERQTLPLDTLKACSAARCARVSYRLHDGATTTVEKDLKLASDLQGASAQDGDPGHMSPFEHQATPLSDPRGYSGNFRGWLQQRQEMPMNITPFDYGMAVARGWRALAYEPLGPEGAVS